jgi:hypothetical protein
MVNKGGSGAAAKRKAKTAAAVLTKRKKANAAAESVIDCGGSEDEQDEECKQPALPTVREGEQGKSSGVSGLCGGMMRPQGREMKELEDEVRETAASAAPGIQAAARPEGTAQTDLVTVGRFFGNADSSTITTPVPRKGEVKMTMVPSGYAPPERSRNGRVHPLLCEQYIDQEGKVYFARRDDELRNDDQQICA